MKKELKRKLLIRELFNKIKGDFNIQNTSLDFEDDKEINGSCAMQKKIDNKVHAIIKLSIHGFGVRIKKGYTNYYYPKRHNRLAFVKNNKHVLVRFVILHELGHVIHGIKCIKENLEYKWTGKETRERFADNFALHHIDKY